MRTLKLQKSVEVHFITKDKFRTLLSENPYIDKIWTIREEITECLSALKNERFDLIVDLHKNLRSKRLQLNLGLKSISFNKLNIEKWLRVHTPINLMPDHHLIDRYFDSLKVIDLKDDGQGMDFYYQVDKDVLFEKIGVVGLADKKSIAVVLGATYLTKRVPDHITETILQRFKDESIVLIGGKDVADQGAHFKNRFPNVINAIGQLTIAESAAIIDYSDCVISGDTGMMHIAAALKKPIVSIWGGTHHDLGMYPYYGKGSSDKNINIVNQSIGCSPCSKIGKHACPKGHFKCMKELDTTKLTDAIEMQLNTTR